MIFKAEKGANTITKVFITLTGTKHYFGNDFLEMCKVPGDYRSKSYKYANETIQIGAVLLDDTFKRIGTLCQYVHPEHGVIDHFIENLTGIKNSRSRKYRI